MECLKFSVKLLLITGVLASFDNSRLPNIYKPQHYDLRILTQLNGPDHLLFEGQVKIRFEALEESNNITLHAVNLTINAAQIQLSSQKGITCVLRTELDERNEFYVMHLCEKLVKLEHYELSMPFEGSLNGSNTGYYWSSYNDSVTTETHYLAVTQFSPTYARLAFPCFDEPHLKATFTVTLGYHKNYTGFSNTPILKCEDHATLENFVWCEHEQLFRTSTYLVAYAVHNLSSISSTSENSSQNITIRNWMQPELIAQGGFLSKLAPKILSYLEELFEINFPLRKIDQLAVPTHKYTAMENWGLITYREDHFAHNDLEEPHSAKEKKSSTMAHECTHQWFGNLVTMKWWNDLWLKEGPSTYFGYLTLDVLMPEWGAGQRYISHDLAMFFAKDSLNDTIAISRNVQTLGSIWEQFTPYVYEKGALTVRMLHKVLGDAIFFTGMRSYLQRFAYDNANQADLWNILQESRDAAKLEVLPLATIMNSWTLQKGYPVVRVYRNYETASLWLNQTRFWLPDGMDSQPDTCWWIPLAFVSQSEPDFEQTQPQFWLECPTAELILQLKNKPTSQEWIMVNPQVNTIYRVDYDEHNWRMIIHTLNVTEHFGGIHVLNRAQLLDDLMALAWTGQRSYELALTALEYLPREQQYLPWKRILDLLNNLAELLPEHQAQTTKLFTKQLMLPLYEGCPKLNSSQMKNESSESIARCGLAYNNACRLGVADCISQAVALTSENNEDMVPVNYRNIVYCTSVEQNDDKLFQLLMQRYKNTTLEYRKRSLAAALGCSRNSTQLEQFLDYLVEANTSSIYMQTVTTALRHGHAALETTKHILQNAKTLNDKLSAKDIKNLPWTIILKSLSHDKDVKLKQELAGLSKFEQMLENAFELRKVHLHWLTHRSEEFMAAITKYIKL